jgi:hypothetical protein
MAFQLEPADRTIRENISLIESALTCYHRIGDTSFDLDRDELLHERSAFEFVRDQLSDAQRAELDVVDAYWRDNSANFNTDFACFHARKDMENELLGFIADDKGITPPIPRSHWWWWPIMEALQMDRDF